MSRVTLVSIAPKEIRVSRGPHVTLNFPACTNGRKYSVDYCDDRTEFKIVHVTAMIAEAELIPIKIKGEEVAKDLMANEWLDREGIVISKQSCKCSHGTEHHASPREYDADTKSMLGDGLHRPCTVPGCDCTDLTVIPSSDELSQARQQRQEWLERYVAAGDAEYSSNGHRIDLVRQECKSAVRELGLKRDWVFTPEGPRPEPTPTHECQGCGSQIQFLSDGTIPAKCKHCGAILDEEKAGKLGLIPKPVVIREQVKVAGPGSASTQFKPVETPTKG